MKNIDVKGTIVSNDDAWIYEWFGYSATSPKMIADAMEEVGNDGVITVDGTDNCLVKLSKCCNPLPGDSIIGFVTRGHGISVHKRDCTNVPRDVTKCEEPERWIRVKWTGKVNKTFQSTLTIHAIDRPQMVADVTMEIANMRLALHSVSAREVKDGNCVVIINISTEGVEHLNNIINRLSRIEGVYLIERTGM